MSSTDHVGIRGAEVAGRSAAQAGIAQGLLLEVLLQRMIGWLHSRRLVAKAPASLTDDERFARSLALLRSVSPAKKPARQIHVSKVTQEITDIRYAQACHIVIADPCDA